MKYFKTYEDLNNAIMSAYTLINWLIENYDHTKMLTKLKAWQYQTSKEWHIEITTISETNIVIPIELTPSKTKWFKFNSDGKELISTTYEFKIK